MSLKTGKQLGFFAALAMLIGSVVGIGIFFKSHGILRTNDWNGIGTLLSWIFGGVLSLAAAVSFSEMGSIKTSKVAGVSAYSEKFVGKKFGYFTRLNFSFFYFGALVVVIGFFGSEILIGMITSLIGKENGARSVPIYGHALVALAIVVGFAALNFFSLKSSGIFQQITTVLKWIPLLLVAILGIAMATTNHNARDNYGKNAFANGTSFSFTGMLAALPAVLFAYDSFLNVLAMSQKIKGGTTKLPKIVIIGMTSVIILYTLIALAASLHGSGMVSGAPFNYGPSVGLGIFDQIFSGKTAEAMGKFVIVFLAISTFGVINGITAAGVISFEQSVHSNTIFGAKTLKNKMGEKWATLLIMSIVFFFWALVEYLPASILKSDSIIDGISNFPTLFMFGLYAIVILFYVLKRKDLSHKKFNNIFYKTFAWIAIVGIIFVVAYQFIYGYFINAILNPKEITHWGLYLGDDSNNGSAFPNFEYSPMTYAQASIVLFTMAAAFLGFPILNWWLTKKFENNDVIVDTQEEAKETVNS